MMEKVENKTGKRRWRQQRQKQYYTDFRWRRVNITAKGFQTQNSNQFVLRIIPSYALLIVECRRKQLLKIRDGTCTDKKTTKKNAHKCAAGNPAGNQESDRSDRGPRETHVRIAKD